MKLLNEAMLNSSLIKQKKFMPVFKVVKSPMLIIANLTKFFKRILDQKHINLQID